MDQPNSGMEPARVAELYEAYSLQLRRFLLGVLKDSEAANDALQATFAKATTAAGTVNPANIRGWLFRVALNQALELRRRTAVDAAARKKWAAQTQFASLTIGDAIVRDEKIERVRAALDQLPYEQRVVVQMRIYDEMTFARIAEAMDLPIGTVLSRMRRAIETLRLALADSRDE